MDHINTINQVETDEQLIKQEEQLLEEIEDESSRIFANASAWDRGSKHDYNMAIYRKNYKYLVLQIKRRVRGNLDAVIVVSGEEGSGKSIFAMELARDLSKNFSFEANVIAIPKLDLVTDMSDKLGKYQPMVLDEAITSMYKRQFASRENIDLNKFYAVCRKRNQITILCIPRLTDLDEQFRNHRVLMNLAIPSAQDTGIVAVHRRDDNMYLKGDKWHFDSSYAITSGGAKAIKKGKYIRFDLLADTEAKIELMQKTPCFVMVVTKDYDKEFDKEYNTFIDRKKEEFLKMQKQLSELEVKAKAEGSTTEQIMREQLHKAVSLLALSGNFDKDTIAKSLSLTKQTVSKMLSKSGIGTNEMKLAKLRLENAYGDPFGTGSAKRKKELQKNKNGSDIKEIHGREENLRQVDEGV